MKIDRIVVENLEQNEFPLDLLSPNYYDITIPVCVYWENGEFVYGSDNLDYVTGVWSPIGDFCEEYFISKAKELNVQHLIIGTLQTETQFFVVGFLEPRVIGKRG